MQVLVAEELGFCFGVEHAIELAEQLLGQGKRVYCLGPLIHNRQVVERLAAAGLSVVDNVDEIPTGPQTGADAEPPTVLIRSHGCRPELLKQVGDRGLRLADATCVLVKRAQKLVGELHGQGYKVVIIGDPDHPEVQGVVGYAPKVTVINGIDELDKLPRTARLAVISQTTKSAEEFGEIVGFIAKRGYHEMKVVNTICRETSRRQASAVEMCQKADVVFVLGSRTSANTCELATLCRRHNAATHHLQDWREFEPEYVRGTTVAGVTAGASTPDWIIREFVDNLSEL